MKMKTSKIHSRISILFVVCLSVLSDSLKAEIVVGQIPPPPENPGPPNPPWDNDFVIVEGEDVATRITTCFVLESKTECIDGTIWKEEVLVCLEDLYVPYPWKIPEGAVKQEDLFETSGGSGSRSGAKVLVTIPLTDTGIPCEPNGPGGDDDEDDDECLYDSEGYKSF